MFCPKCGNEQPDGVKFCGKCGTEFPDQASASGAEGAVAVAKPAAKSKKPAIIVAVIVAIALIAGIVWLVIPKAEPLYLPTWEKRYRNGDADGEIRYEYVDGFLSKYWDSGLYGTEDERTRTYERDDNGLIQSIAWTNFFGDGETSETDHSYELNTQGLPSILDTDSTKYEYEYSNGLMVKRKMITHSAEYEWLYDSGWLVGSSCINFNDADVSIGNDYSYELTYTYNEEGDLPIAAFKKCIFYTAIRSGKKTEEDPSKYDEQIEYAYDENGCLVSQAVTSGSTTSRTEYGGYIKIDHPTPLMIFDAMNNGLYWPAKRVEQQNA